MCSATLRPQDAGRGHGFEQSADRVISLTFSWKDVPQSGQIQWHARVAFTVAVLKSDVVLRW